MKVYSVVEEVDYEGGTLLGVFGSKDEAVQFAKSYRGHMEQWVGYSYGVVESELGQPMDYYENVYWVE